MEIKSADREVMRVRCEVGSLALWDPGEFQNSRVTECAENYNERGNVFVWLLAVN